MMKLDFYDKVEEANKTILRRSSPCPSEYETYVYISTHMNYIIVDVFLDWKHLMKT